MASYDTARGFINNLPAGARVAIAYHGDADGTGSAALAYRFLERTGRKPVVAIAPNKGEDLYSETFAARLREARPEALWVLDQGSRPRAILPETPTLVVDHHDPPADPVPVAIYLSGIHETPVPPASLMTWRLLSPLTNLNDISWYMAVGVMGDLGNEVSFPELTQAKKVWGQKNISETVAMVNAAKRSASHDTQTSLTALLKAENPADIANGMIEEYDQLAEYREEVQAERTRCAKTAPKFSEDYALLRFSSPCQLHGPVASAWVGRLPKFIVIAANDGYTAGNVHFSIRTRRPEDNLLERLRAVRDVVDAPELGQGHAQATGGVLPTAKFERLLVALGFE